MNLRRGLSVDVPVLNALALDAKARWGYSSEQLAVWKADLLVAPDLHTTHPVCIAEVQGEVVGFVQVATDTQPWELSGLWVRPSCMGQGIGKVLLEWAKELAASGGQAELAIDADPNAEGFYRACGARQVGSVPAPIEGDAMRVRPQLRLPTSAA